MEHSELMRRVEAIADRLKRDYHAQTVILYGSRATGIESPDSDTDLLVVAPTREKFFERMTTVLRLVRDLYKGLALSPIVLTPEEINQRLNQDDPFVKEILASGIKL